MILIDTMFKEESSYLFFVKFSIQVRGVGTLKAAMNWPSWPTHVELWCSRRAKWPTSCWTSGPRGFIVRPDMLHMCTEFIHISSFAYVHLEGGAQTIKYQIV